MSVLAKLAMLMVGRLAPEVQQAIEDHRRSIDETKSKNAQVADETSTVIHHVESVRRIIERSSIGR